MKRRSWKLEKLASEFPSVDFQKIQARLTIR